MLAVQVFSEHFPPCLHLLYPACLTILENFPSCSKIFFCIAMINLKQFYFKTYLPCLFNIDMRVGKLICHWYFQNVSMCRQPPSRYRSFSSFLPSSNELVGPRLVRLLAMQWPFSLGCSILLSVAENTKYQRHFGSFEQFLLTSGFYGDFYARKSKRRLSLAQGFYSNITKALLLTI